MICNKPLTSAPPRLQAMLLDTQGYDYRIQYVPGKDVGLADALSRLPNYSDKGNIPLDVKVNTMSFSEVKITDIREETQRDATLNALKELIYNGFPDYIKDVPSDLRSFWSYRDELSIDNGVIMKGERICIPLPLKTDILTNLHTGHFGIVKTQQRARRDVYRPKINTDIEKLCKTCPICQEHQPQQPP